MPVHGLHGIHGCMALMIVPLGNGGITEERTTAHSQLLGIHVVVKGQSGLTGSTRRIDQDRMGMAVLEP